MKCRRRPAGRSTYGRFSEWKFEQNPPTFYPPVQYAPQYRYVAEFIKFRRTTSNHPASHRPNDVLNIIQHGFLPSEVPWQQNGPDSLFK
jgi:hypothetical protein